jgi:hypothetical protein
MPADASHALDVRLLEGTGSPDLVDAIADALYDRDDIVNQAVTLDEHTRAITVSFEIPIEDAAEAYAAGTRAVAETLATALA